MDEILDSLFPPGIIMRRFCWSGCFEGGQPARGNIDIGVSLTNKSNYTKALEVFLGALQQAEKSGDAQMQSAAPSNLFRRANKYDSARLYATNAFTVSQAGQAGPRDSFYLIQPVVK